MDFKKTVLFACTMLCMSGIGFAEEPLVTQQITIKPGDTQMILRYYSPLDITKVAPPFNATWEDGSKATVNYFYNYNITTFDYYSGQVVGGFDQYAQYFEIDLRPGVLTLHGNFPKVAYFSATTYDKNHAFTGVIKDRDLLVSPGWGNPAAPGNKSILFYTDDQYKDVPVTPIHYDVTPKFDKKISVYRPDKFNTSIGWEEDMAPDGCSQAYLSTARYEVEPDYMLLRMKMPTTFFRYGTRDTTFGHYQSQEFSISSTLKNLHDKEPVLDFWTVNSYMLSKLKNPDGYIYVLFAPRDKVQALVKMENLPPRTPPTVNLGTGKAAYNAYVLGTPTHAVILRYRSPNDQWVGSPMHATCYDDPKHNMPIEDNELGEYTPTITGGSFPELDHLIK